MNIPNIPLSGQLAHLKHMMSLHRFSEILGACTRIKIIHPLFFVTGRKKL